MSIKYSRAEPSASVSEPNMRRSADGAFLVGGEASSVADELEQQKRTKAEQNKADRAEKSRDKQVRKDEGGPLGNVGDNLSGR